MIHFFPNLRRDEVENLPPELTVFLFSVGGLEQHGAHLPLGAKWFIAEHAVRTLSEKLNSKMPLWHFVLMPTLPLVIDPYTSKMAFSVRAHVLRDYLVDQCQALKRQGFYRFAVYSSHASPRQLSAIEEAGKIVSKRRVPFQGAKPSLISITSQEVTSAEVMRSPMIAHPKEHGGALETSALLHIKKELVSAQYLSLAPVSPQKQDFSRLFSYWRNELDGYWGKPSEADEKFYLSNLNERMEKTATLLQAFFESGQGASIFNSGYRYFFFNGSFFVAYLLGAIFFVMMLVWTLWGLRDVFEP